MNMRATRYFSSRSGRVILIPEAKGMEPLATQRMENSMTVRPSGYLIVALLALVLSLATALEAQAASVQPPSLGDGVVSTQSVFGFGETIARLKKDIADKGIVIFAEIDRPNSPRTPRSR